MPFSRDSGHWRGPARGAGMTWTEASAGFQAPSCGGPGLDAMNQARSIYVWADVGQQGRWMSMSRKGWQRKVFERHIQACLSVAHCMRTPCRYLKF